jgi:hypothetical protein
MKLTTSMRTALRVAAAFALLIGVSWLVSWAFWLLSQPSDLKMGLGFVLLLMVFVAGVGLIEKLISAPIRGLLSDTRNFLKWRRRKAKKEADDERRNAETDGQRTVS